MHDSFENDEKEGEVSCDCLKERVFRENSLNKVIGKEPLGCKCARSICAEEKKNRGNREYMRIKRDYENLNENSKFIEKKRERNREYMQKKRDEESLDGNSDALLKQRALNKEYMKKKGAEESLDGNSETLEKKCALNK